MPPFNLHSAEKNPHRIFRKLPVDNFPHSAIRKINIPYFIIGLTKSWLHDRTTTAQVLCPNRVPGTPLQRLNVIILCSRYWERISCEMRTIFM